MKLKKKLRWKGRVAAPALVVSCLILSCILFSKIQAQVYGYGGHSTMHHNFYSVYSDYPHEEDQALEYTYEPQPPTTPKTYGYPYYYYRHSAPGQSFSGDINFGRRYDNSANFSTGVSSYQGTSTGPGPNGGYPGTPHGIYKTDYYDTSLYPNTYMRVYPY